jgi:hypothetical protein
MKFSLSTDANKIHEIWAAIVQMCTFVLKCQYNKFDRNFEVSIKSRSAEGALNREAVSKPRKLSNIEPSHTTS